ncbi:rifin [Plasmodium reichenowi]|uniref:Rifin n=1 Tax=Plasmodium reichenowi TaxID=5854 RepID=A0A060RQ54_PLARE|nr:rifin [Plasmodium reichenowi]
MKVHYINILLFALPFNISEHNQRNHKSTKSHTQTKRSLCECELYAPVNYDSDAEMKRVMQQFEGRTSQRFHEYDERMVEKRKRCKDKCDKEIQKIILKDKLEKQMAQQLTTLETKIDTYDIPTCVCEKSMADKVEKECLRCGYGLGTVAPTVGLIGSVAVNVWKTTKIAAATQEAIAKGALAGEAARIPAAIKAVIEGIKSTFGVSTLGDMKLSSYITPNTYTQVTNITAAVYEQYLDKCVPRLLGGFPSFSGVNLQSPVCKSVLYSSLPGSGVQGQGVKATNIIGAKVEGIVSGAEQAAKAEATQVAAAEKAAVLDTSKKSIEAASTHLYTTISYSITAILIIVLIMVIIYLILRYRRKKKMKKKLQYIKLLEE